MTLTFSSVLSMTCSFQKDSPVISPVWEFTMQWENHAVSYLRRLFSVRLTNCRSYIEHYRTIRTNQQIL